MASANIKLGVEYSQFKQGMKEAQESVKTLTEKLKQNESQLQLTGDKEIYLKNKVDLLTQQIEAQRAVVANAKNALDSLAAGGVDKASTQYQQMERNVYKATDQLNKMEIELRDVETGADKAGNEAQQMNDELKKVGDGVAWDNVTKGLDSIISKLESGARAAISFGKKIISSAKGSTGWADELITLSKQTGIDMTTLQQMQKVAEFVDTDVDAILNAQQRMKAATQSAGGKTALEEVLGISLNGQTADDLFWEIGDSLVNMGEAFDKESAAQKVFGRSWKELMPLFLTGREEYEKMLGEQNTLTDEQVQKLGQADDAIKQVEQQIQDLKNTFWAENADKITDLMQWFVDNKDAVVAALTAIGAAFGTLKLASFALNLQKAVNGFKELGLLGGGSGGTTGSQTGTTVPGTSSGTSETSKGWGTGFADKFAQGAASGFLWREAARLREMYETNLGGLSVEEQQAKALLHDLGVTQEELLHWGDQHLNEDPMSWTGRGHSFGEEATEVSASLDRMTEVAGATNDVLPGVQQSSESMTNAATALMDLPGLIQTAIANGMSAISIIIDASGIDAMQPRIAGGISDKLVQMTK